HFIENTVLKLHKMLLRGPLKRTANKVLSCNLFQIRLSKFLSFLLDNKLVQLSPGRFSDPKFFWFIAWKGILYSYLVLLFIRTLIFSYLLKHKYSIQQHAQFDPVLR